MIVNGNRKTLVWTLCILMVSIIGGYVWMAVWSIQNWNTASGALVAAFSLFAQSFMRLFFDLLKNLLTQKEVNEERKTTIASVSGAAPDVAA